MTIRWLIALSMIAVSAAGQARDSRQLRGTTLEFAPLRGAFGQASVRVEQEIGPDGMAVSGSYNQFERHGSRDDFRDYGHSWGIACHYYPRVLPGAFVSAGLRQEKEWVGRRQAADGLTGIAVTSDRTHDLWVDENDYQLLRVGGGYRIFWKDMITSSLRLSFDQVVSSKSTPHPDQIYSLDPNLEGRKDDKPRQSLAMFIGVRL